MKNDRLDNAKSIVFALFIVIFVIAGHLWNEMLIPDTSRMPIELGEIAQLQALFNQDEGRIRLILLLSRSCLRCNETIDLLDQMLESWPSVEIDVYAVWLNDGSVSGHSSWSPEDLADRRVTHLSDEKNITRLWFSRYLGSENENGFAWTAFFLYGPKARWDRILPSPAIWGSSIVNNLGELYRTMHWLWVLQ